MAGLAYGHRRNEEMGIARLAAGFEARHQGFAFANDKGGNISSTILSSQSPGAKQQGSAAMPKPQFPTSPVGAGYTGKFPIAPQVLAELPDLANLAVLTRFSIACAASRPVSAAPFIKPL